ncbi:MAG: hypothetical protein HZB56_14200 [Deltaproteobacteria bacterium]|nr:hypothetical protein [Deltaproteobacteria bacterium]
MPALRSLRAPLLLLLLPALAACGGSDSSKAAAPTCDLSGAVPVAHGSSPSGSETWASGVHRVTTTLTIPASATLTIAACARVELAPDASLIVNGGLVAAGTAAGPISFVRSTAASPWAAIQVLGSADLAHTTLAGGGGSLPMATSDTLGAPLFVHGFGTPVPRLLKVTQVTVDGTTGIGVALVGAGFEAGSTGLTVRNAGSYPLYLGADVADTLPAGDYAANASPAIALQTAYFAGQDNQRTIGRDLTIPNRGVPYRVGIRDPGTIRIGSATGPAPLVTVEPGVVIAFPRATFSTGRILVDGATSGAAMTVAQGALRAVGTAAAPVVFRSAEATPAAGDWTGLSFTGVDARTRLERVEIRHAGGNSGALGTCTTNSGATTSEFDGDAALQIFVENGYPAASFLASSTIAQSAGSGIYRAWSVGDVDFLAGNALSGIAFCSQTLVPDDLNVCPAGPCPAAP